VIALTRIADLSSRKEYWNNLRIVIRIMLFRDFENLLRNLADPPRSELPDSLGNDRINQSKILHPPKIAGSRGLLQFPPSI